MDIFGFNSVTGESSSFFGSASLGPDQLQVNRGLTHATLDVVVEVCSSSPTNAIPLPNGLPECFDVTIDLTWTDNGPLRRSSDSFHFQSAGFKTNSHLQASFRNARVIGSLSGDSIKMTDADARIADMFTFRFGDITISGF